jgi:protocatechuate 3,4-dioxygenase beta subunit
MIVAAVALATTASAQEPGPFRFGVRGTVLDRDRRAVPGAEVRLVREQARGATLARTVAADSNGRFEASGWFELPSRFDGDWRIEVRAEGYATSMLDELYGNFGVYDVGPIYLFEPVPVGGIVLDSAGRPIAGAELRTVPSGSSWSRIGAALQTRADVTDGSGRFELRTLAPGRVKLGVAAAGFADRVLDLELHEGRASQLEIRMQPEQLLEGIVVDPQGVPVAGAVVETLSNAFWSHPIVTDPQGRFALRGLPHDWRSEGSVKAHGFVPASLAGLSASDALIQLEPSRTLLIRAVRQGEGPEPEIHHVRIHDSTPPYGCSLSYGYVDLAAEPWVVEVLSPSRWRVHLDAALARSGHYSPPASGVSVQMTDGAWSGASLELGVEREPELTVSVRPTGAISGRVLRRDTEEPIAGAVAILNDHTVQGPHLVCTSDEKGCISFTGVAASDLHSISVRDEQWSGGLGQVRVRPANVTQGIELWVSAPRRISGRVTMGGVPPGQPIVIGLGEYQDTGVVPGGVFGLGISDEQGNYSVVPRYARRFTVVPKTPATPDQGGYRRFRSEFPDTAHGTWPWHVDAAAGREVRLDLDLAR